uniref:Uncharacterized protein n=1 Tax=Cacopsylla melanoneura TaxID=428564 RepID=A0A8D9E6S9_9HEMI
MQDDQILTSLDVKRKKKQEQGYEDKDIYDRKEYGYDDGDLEDKNGKINRKRVGFDMDTKRKRKQHQGEEKQDDDKHDNYKDKDVPKPKMQRYWDIYDNSLLNRFGESGVKNINCTLLENDCSGPTLSTTTDSVRIIEAVEKKEDFVFIGENIYQICFDNGRFCHGLSDGIKYGELFSIDDVFIHEFISENCRTLNAYDYAEMIEDINYVYNGELCTFDGDMFDFSGVNDSGIVCFLDDAMDDPLIGFVDINIKQLEDISDRMNELKKEIKNSVEKNSHSR